MICWSFRPCPSLLPVYAASTTLFGSFKVIIGPCVQFTRFTIEAQELYADLSGSGRCSLCLKSVIAKVRNREVEASIVLAACHLKSIKSVEWSSLFSGFPYPEDDNNEPEFDGGGQHVCNEAYGDNDIVGLPSRPAT